MRSDPIPSEPILLYGAVIRISRSLGYAETMSAIMESMNMRLERQIVIWSLILLVAMLVVALIRDAILPFVLGALLAYALNPLVTRLINWTRLPRIVASALVLLLGLALIGVTLVMVVPLVVDQMQKLALSLPDLAKQWRVVIDDIARERLGSRYPEFAGAIDRAMTGVTGNWSAIASNTINQLLAQAKTLVNIVSLLLIAPLVAFYILADWEPMLAKIDGWLPREHAPALRKLAKDINDAISAFIRGQGVVCLILAFYYAVSLQIIGLQYGLLIGVTTGILSFVPFVGWALGLIVSLALAIAQFWPVATPILLVGAVFIVGQALDAAVLSPAIVGSRIGLHPIGLLFALIAFSSLFGFVGVLIAVPVAAAIAVLVRFALDAYLASELYKGGSLDKGGGNP